MNLLQETMNALKENGKTPADVRWVGRASISAKCSTGIYKICEEGDTWKS